MTAVVFGSINMDLVSRVPRLPVPGETLTGTQFFTAPGGKGANQAVACARLGLSTVMVGRVGDDVFGASLLESLQSANVETRYVMVTPGSSGLAVIQVDERGENSIVIIPGANAQVGADDLDHLQAALESASTLLLQLEIPMQTVLAAAHLARMRDLRVILDPAPAVPLPDELYKLVDILTPNETEAAILLGLPAGSLSVSAPAGMADLEQAARSLQGRGARQVVIKLGARGAYAHDRETGQLVPAFPVQAVDTTAAGDAFNAGLAAGLHAGLPLFEAVRLGNAAGALSATRPGAQGSMPTIEEVADLLAGL